MILDISPLIRNRDYRLLYTGQLVSAFGSMITYVAVPQQIWELTHSSFAVPSIGARDNATGVASHHHTAATMPSETTKSASGVRKRIVLLPKSR